MVVVNAFILNSFKASIDSHWQGKMMVVYAFILICFKASIGSHWQGRVWLWIHLK